MKIPQSPPEVDTLGEGFKQEFNSLLSTCAVEDDRSRELRELVRRYNEQQYLHWDDLRRRHPLPASPEAVWMLLRFLREGKSRILRLDNETFRFVVIEKFLKELHVIDKSSPATVDLWGSRSLSESARHQYLANSLMEEAIASSRLEGAATTRDLAKRFLREGKRPKTHAERMILNNYLTITHLKSIRNEPLTSALIIQIHQEITQRTLDTVEDEWRYRTSNDILVKDKVDATRVYHYPPDFEKVPGMIEDLCDFANRDDEFIHPIIKAIILHFLIGYIHPFNDGNGRTARALFYWYVLKHNYDLFEYLSISNVFLRAPARYTRAFLYSETDRNDMTYFIDFNLTIIGEALDRLKAYIVKKQQEERDSLRIVETLPGLSFRQAEILKDFIKYPYRPFTVREIAGKFRVSVPTARHDLEILTQQGRVRQIEEGTRRLYLLREGTSMDEEQY
ncbi:MAG: Fic family protein [Methanospirillum sp.]